MALHVWLAFLAAACLIAVSPGSGAVLSMGHGLTYGVRGASPSILGLQAGLSVILLIAGLGVGALLLASAQAFWAVKVAGAAYLVWLGIQQWRAPVHEGRAAPGAGGAPVLSVRQRFLAGLTTNLTNPKGIVFMVAVLPQFLDPSRPVWLQLLILWATMIGVDLTVMHGYAWLASRLQRWLSSVRARRTQNRVLGTVLMGMGASLLGVRHV